VRALLHWQLTLFTHVLSHAVVVDEVHERQLDTDVLLGFLRQSLPTYPNLCVILMSATMDSERFERYFGAPHIHVPGRTFPVTDHMLEDVLAVTGFIPPKKKKKGKPSYSYSNNQKKSSAWNDSEISDGEGADGNEEGEGEDLPVKDVCKLPLEVLLERIDETAVNADLICRLVVHLVRNKKSNDDDDGSILVFLPGAPEINNTLETIKRGTKDFAVMLLPLHGGLQPKEQSRIFQRAPNGFTKVVLSTNVAETRSVIHVSEFS